MREKEVEGREQRVWTLFVFHPRARACRAHAILTFARPPQHTPHKQRATESTQTNTNTAHAHAHDLYNVRAWRSWPYAAQRLNARARARSQPAHGHHSRNAARPGPVPPAAARWRFQVLALAGRVGGGAQRRGHALRASRTRRNRARASRAGELRSRCPTVPVLSRHCAATPSPVRVLSTGSGAGIPTYAARAASPLEQVRLPNPVRRPGWRGRSAAGGARRRRHLQGGGHGPWAPIPTRPGPST